VLAEWPDNSLRHSFATYHLGRAKNAGLTAYQMGHTSSAMVQRVYSVPAAMADWQAWWNI
jgi:integrase